MKDHVIICGLGNIGFRVFELLRRADIPVAVISTKTHAEWAWEVEHWGGLFFQGDARDDNLLLEAGIKEAKAILALTDRDQINLSIAVDAQKLNPTIQIISRIFDTELGNLVAESFNIQQVFSTSELAAPLFSNSLDKEKILGKFTFHGEDFLVYEFQALPSDPAFSVLTNSNDKFLVAESIKTTTSKSSWVHKLISFYYSCRTPLFIFFRRFLIILFMVILFSTLILSKEMNIRFIDALYFVVATVSSVGYGDINLLNSPDRVKIFGCLLMLTGTAIIAILFSSVTEMILTRKLPNFVGGRPIPRKSHVIVVGADHIGDRIVSLLIDKNIPIVVIENDLKIRFPQDIARQVAVVTGNPKSENTLLRANIKNAKAIVAVAQDDIENLSISLAAKKFNPAIKEIIQINNTAIGGNLKVSLALTSVFSVPFIAAPYFFASIFETKILFAVEWEGQIVYIYDNNHKIEVRSRSLIKKV